MLHLLVVMVVACLALLAAGPVDAAKRVALIIGVAGKFGS